MEKNQKPRRLSRFNLTSRREGQRRYLALRSKLRALMIHMRARGQRAIILKRGIFIGVQDGQGSVSIPSRSSQLSIRTPSPIPRKVTKPTWPWFGKWQEKRYVLLKPRPRGRMGLAYLR